MSKIDTETLKVENLNGIYSDLADLLDVDAVLKLHRQYRGTQIFFPMELFSKEYIFSRIAEEYNGRNIRELAIKYGYTEKWIRKILNEHAQLNK